MVLLTILLAGAGLDCLAQDPADDTAGYAEGREEEGRDFEGNPDPAALNLPRNTAAPTEDQWQAITHDKAYDYRNEIEDKPVKQDESQPDSHVPELPTGLLKLLLLILVVAVAGFVIYSITGGRGGLFAKNSKRRGAGGPSAEQDELVGLPGQELERRMLESAAAGDLRAAIRFGFLRTLQMLNEHGDIAYLPEKTNYAYELELKDSALRQSFRAMRITYERAWYGASNPGQNSYSDYRVLFDNLKNAAVR